MEVCLLCNNSEDDELTYGEILSVENISVHYFCLLFAPGLYTRGKDDEGIRGFLLNDIEGESKRVKKLICCYCSNQNANLGCCVKSCQRAYHLKCATKKGVSFEFSGNFETFCKTHARFVQKENPSSKENCGICLGQMHHRRKSILLPCCKKWLHKSCLQKFALSSGYYFKCPFCNDKTQCHETLPMFGIFIPRKEADWELENDIFEDLFDSGLKTCDTSSCLAGNVTYADSPWAWKICSICGSSAIHEMCLNAAVAGGDFNCKSCTGVLRNMAGRSNIPLQSLDNQHESINNTGSRNNNNHESFNKSSVQSSSLMQPDTSRKNSTKKTPKSANSFISWFSDDEQASDDEDKKVFVPMTGLSSCKCLFEE